MRTLAEKLERWSIPEPNSGCLLWLGTMHSKTGYGGTNDAVNGRRILTAHRAAWEVANGRRVPKGQMVRHKCDVKLCINPAHLELGTARDNILDAVKRGQHRRKLSDEQIRSIFYDPDSQRKIAAKHSISQVNVWRIKNRGIFKHITETL